MNTKLKYIIGIVAVLILALFVKFEPGVLVAGAGSGEPSGFDNVPLTGGLKLGVTPGDVSLPSYGNGSLLVTGPLVASSTAYFAQDIVEGGICSRSLASTTNTYLVTSSDLQNCSMISITSGSTTGSVAVQLPATSTVTGFVNPGDSATLYVYAASTTANNLVITATTTAGFAIASPIGIASTTAASSTIPAGNVGILDILRLPTTNMTAVITPSK